MGFFLGGMGWVRKEEEKKCRVGNKIEEKNGREK